MDFESPVAVNGSIERDGDLLYVTGEVRARLYFSAPGALGP